MKFIGQGRGKNREKLHPNPNPSEFAGLKPDMPIDHPKGRQYAYYAKKIRFPLPFWEWLEREDKARGGLGYPTGKPENYVSPMQRKMNNETFCRSPLATRIHRTSKPGAKARYYPRWNTE